MENRNLLQETLRELEAVSVLRAKQVASKLNQGNNVPYSDVYDTYAIQESSYRQVKLFIVIILGGPRRELSYQRWSSNG